MILALRILHSVVWDTETYRTHDKSKLNHLSQMLWEKRVGSIDSESIVQVLGARNVLHTWYCYSSYLSFHGERRTSTQDLRNSVSQGEEMWKHIRLPGMASCLEWLECRKLWGRKKWQDMSLEKQLWLDVKEWKTRLRNWMKKKVIGGDISWEHIYY